LLDISKTVSGATRLTEAGKAPLNLFPDMLKYLRYGSVDKIAGIVVS